MTRHVTRTREECQYLPEKLEEFGNVEFLAPDREKERERERERRYWHPRRIASLKFSSHFLSVSFFPSRCPFPSFFLLSSFPLPVSRVIFAFHLVPRAIALPRNNSAPTTLDNHWSRAYVTTPPRKLFHFHPDEEESTCSRGFLFQRGRRQSGEKTRRRKSVDAPTRRDLVKAHFNSREAKVRSAPVLLYWNSILPWRTSDFLPVRNFPGIRWNWLSPTISFRLSVYKRRLLIRVFRVSRNKGEKKDAFPRGRELLPGRLLQRNVTEESRDTCVRAHVSAMETKRVETDGRGTSSRFIDALKSRTRHRFVSSSDKAF